MRLQLCRDWTSSDGVRHRAGELVEVDDATCSELRDAGLAASVEPAEGDCPCRGIGTLDVPVPPSYSQDDTLVVGDDPANPAGPGRR